MIERIKQITAIEWALVEAIIFILVWLSNPYLAKLLTFVLSPIFLAILVVSLIADRFDQSKIGSTYYLTLLMLAIGPIIIFFLFNALN